jgi:lipopolysaccharide/colanic/teichoic acid biosynthesis glycosyltransferase
VLWGDMSVVGPRPEVRKFVDLYSPEQKGVLSIKPGITDYASLLYKDENDILAGFENPEQAYIEQVMPHKLRLNLKYLNNQTFVGDLKIIWRTVLGILS